MLYNLLDLASLVRSWGRGVVCRAPVWDGVSPLELTHLGDTEGDIVVNTNPAIAGLTTPELTGPAIHEADYEGESPSIEIPMYMTDPAQRAIVSPSGIQSAGRRRRTPAAEHTLVLFPEALFLLPQDPITGSINVGTLSYTMATGWQFEGAALSPAKELLLGETFFAWRGYFSRPPRSYKGGAGDARKNIETVTFQLMHHASMPDGHHLYTIGDPTSAGIDLEAGVAS